MAEEKKAVAGAAPKKQRKNNIFKWFRELRAEMKKVIWSSRKQVVNNTMIVILAVFIVGIFVWSIDIVFKFGRDILISTFG